ncbi:MAG: flagellar basal body rod protein FlgB [Nitrospiraceae bacterium]|nr:flagellar basal body rod protein FlgB [Nitrospiraceae bacterium]
MNGGIGLLEKLIDYTVRRHAVLASNIANAETPSYKARDVKFEDFMEGRSVKLLTTDSKHMTGTGVDGAGGIEETETTSPWLDRNNVEVDVEVAKMTENALVFQTAIKMLSTRISMIKNALNT